MAANQPKSKFAIIQSELVWIAGVCLGLKFYLDSNDAKETFGTWIQLAKQINLSTLLIMTALSGRYAFRVIVSSNKVKQAVKDAIQESNPLDET